MANDDATVVVENEVIHPLLPANFPMGTIDWVLVALDAAMFAQRLHMR